MAAPRDQPKPVNPLTGTPEFNGTSLIDVTDPAHPQYLAHIPAEEGTYEAGGAQMVRVCDGKSLPKGDPNAVYLLRPFGNQAHEIWNTADPAHPVLVTRIVEGLKGTHKSWWECDTGIAYLVSGEPGWRVPRMTQIYDLSDPAHPAKIRDFGLPGQEPGASGTAPTMLHGMISLPKANRVYFGYGTNTGGILQIVDRDKLIHGPAEPTEANLLAPEVGRFQMSALNGAHTTFPVLEMPVAEFAKDKIGKVRNFVVITDEQIKNECQEARQMAWFVDVTVEKTPVSVATWGVPEASGNFCSRGGRFGTHSSNENMTPIYYEPGHVLRPFQRRRARGRHPRPVSPEGDRLLHPGGHSSAATSAAPRSTRWTEWGQRALRQGDPDQQCRGRRPRLHLHRRPRQ